jgi:hypothetical protein
MKSIVFDAGPIISLTTNNLLWLLDDMKARFNGEFYIPEAVKQELVDRPLASKKFKFEALQVGFRIRKGVLTIMEMPQIKALAQELVDLSNSIFKIKGNWIKIVHYAEMEALATSIILNSSAVVIDERTAKMLVEDPKKLAAMLEQNLGSKVFIEQGNLNKVREWTKNIKIIRSVELVLVAYEKGMLDKYLMDGPESKKTLVESLLWGVKIHGCAVSRREIDQLVVLETAGKE